MTTYKAIVVHPTDEPRVIELENGNDLGELQTLVGGYIDCVYSEDRRITFFVNDEGRIEGLPLNHLATGAWWNFNTTIPRVPDAQIVGTVVITGPADEDGESTSVGDEVREYFGLKS